MTSKHSPGTPLRWVGIGKKVVSTASNETVAHARTVKDALYIAHVGNSYALLISLAEEVAKGITEPSSLAEWAEKIMHEFEDYQSTR